MDLLRLTAKIIDENTKTIGTGFFIAKDIVVTARHNIVTINDIETIDNTIEQDIRIECVDGKVIAGHTLNFVEAYNRKIDCVFIKLNENAENIKLLNAVKTENSIKDFDFITFGFLLNNPDGIEIKGTVKQDTVVQGEINKDFVLNVYDNIDYSGLSGAPIIVDNDIVGIIIQQDDNSNLYGISMKIIEQIIQNDYKKYNSSKYLRNVKFELEENLYIEYFKKAEKIAGPRFNKELSVDTPTKRNLMIFLNQIEIEDEMNNSLKKLEKYASNLQYCLSGHDSFSGNENENLQLVMQNTEKIFKLVSEIINENDKKINNFTSIINLSQETHELANNIYFAEFEKFEKRHGGNAFDNKIWRNHMQSYKCILPWSKLEILGDFSKELNEFIEYLKNSNLELRYSQVIMLKGRGGTGKTHTLCDTVRDNIIMNIPSFVFFGNMFNSGASPEKVILDKLSITNINFDDFLYRLDRTGEDLKRTILICIDAINETKDISYWNDNIVEFITKFENYKNIKLIFSCRNIYLNERLKREVVDTLHSIEQSDFEKLKNKAIKEFFSYYKIDIPVADVLKNEYSNPLFLKLYCECMKKNRELDILSFDELICLIIDNKNDDLSIKYSEFSKKDKIIKKCIYKITEEMINGNTNTLTWMKVKDIIGITLDENYVVRNVINDIAEDLISENILIEHDEDNISFAFERFYDYLVAKYVIDNTNDFENLTNMMFENYGIYKGALEFITVMYFRKFDKEIIDCNNIESSRYNEVFLTSLYLRKNSDFNYETKIILEYNLMKSTDVVLRKASFEALFQLAIKKECNLNAYYFHRLMKFEGLINRDVILGNMLIGRYDEINILSNLVEMALELDSDTLDGEAAELWGIVLVWLTSLSYAYVRDRASKALVNIFNHSPETSIKLIEQFSTIEDDYIQERLWGAIYASLIITRNVDILGRVLDYIYMNYINHGAMFPTNIILRTTLRNIAEFANELDVLNYDISEFRPPFRSNIIKFKKINPADKMKFRDLFYNCSESDFIKYTVPDYSEIGYSRKRIGELIFNEIIAMGYNNSCINLDGFIDQEYGTERTRDLKYERVGKKYQKIALYNILGRIYDEHYNYFIGKYNASSLIIGNYSNRYREIDLTSIPKKNIEFQFDREPLQYDWNKTCSLPHLDWINNDDLTGTVKNILNVSRNNKEYLLLNTDYVIKDNKESSDEYREIWVKVYSCLINRDELNIFLEWVKDKHFGGGWFPEGFTSLYDGWIGEYPWSPYYKNLLDSKDDYYHDDKYKIPVSVVPTANSHNDERDSINCKSEISADFMFPSPVFFDKLNLVWNLQNTYKLNDENMFINTTNGEGGLYCNRQLLDKFLDENNLALVWTILGDKSKKKRFRTEFLGYCEFSETYTYCDSEIKVNHYKKIVNTP